MKFPPNIVYNHRLNEIRTRVLNKKEALEKKRPISSAILNRLKEDFAVEWTYNSNHIEGNTLTLPETKLILEDGIAIGGKTLREHFEVVNHEKAIHFLEELVDREREIRAIDILSLHEVVMANILDEYAGRIRPGMVRIIGANFTPPTASKVPELLESLIDFTNCNTEELDVISLATVFHHRLVWIHPFNDGNGRTVRLAMNLILMKAGFPPSFILTKDRKKYFRALNEANKGHYSALLLIIFQAVERSLNLYLTAIGGDYEDYLPTGEIAEDPAVPYGQEYLSLLARRGRIDAYKEGRIWYTTRSAVEDYRARKLK